MSVTMFFVIWYTIGVLAMVLAVYTEYKTGEDFTLLDAFLSVVGALFGPVIMIFAVSFYFKHFPMKTVVLIKGSKKGVLNDN